MIVFDEKKYVEEVLLKDKDFKIVSQNELSLIIRYYVDEGKNIREVRDIIKNIGCGILLETMIEDDYVFTGIFVKATARKIRKGEPIIITKYEYDFVRSVGDPEKEKILFAMIVMQKIFGVDKFLATFKDIKTISLSQKNKKDMQNAICDLNDSGYITMSGWRNYKINIDKLQVLKSEPYLYVDDFDRVTVPYLKTLKTEEYFFCEWCGRKIKYKKNDSHARKYCDKCSKIKNKYRSKT